MENARPISSHAEPWYTHLSKYISASMTASEISIQTSIFPWKISIIYRWLVKPLLKVFVFPLETSGSPVPWLQPRSRRGRGRNPSVLSIFPEKLFCSFIMTKKIGFFGGFWVRIGVGVKIKNISGFEANSYTPTGLQFPPSSSHLEVNVNVAWCHKHSRKNMRKNSFVPSKKPTFWITLQCIELDSENYAFTIRLFGNKIQIRPKCTLSFVANCLS